MLASTVTAVNPTYAGDFIQPLFLVGQEFLYESFDFGNLFFHLSQPRGEEFTERDLSAGVGALTFGNVEVDQLGAARNQCHHFDFGCHARRRRLGCKGAAKGGDSVAAIRATDGSGTTLRVLKSELNLRPIWHRIDRRVEAHVFIALLGYVLWARPEAGAARLGQFHHRAWVLESLTGRKCGSRCVMDAHLPAANYRT
jgi:hypothetical protein